MKSTILATLALGLVTSVSGVIFKFLHFSGGSGMLIGGIFLVLLGGALLALNMAANAQNET